MCNKAITFGGHQTAELFTRMLRESIAGSVAHNIVWDAGAGLPVGFARASIEGRVWFDTSWSRDTGAYVRELALYGRLDAARAVAAYLITHIDRNPEGYRTCPERFEGSGSGWGSELDGTANVVVGLVRLWQRLPPDDALRGRIGAFLSQDDSPVRYIAHKLQHAPLIAGTGEFGGGWCVDGAWYNTMQNFMLRQALMASAECFEQMGRGSDARALRERADRLQNDIVQMLTDEADGGWLWCVDPNTRKPDEQAMLGRCVHGTAAVNGIGAVYADADGLDTRHWVGRERTLATLERVLGMPNRKRLFERYGVCAHVEPVAYDEGGADADAGFIPTHASWLSYCDCYAMQTMLLCDDTRRLEAALSWIVAATLMDGSPDEATIRAVREGRAMIDPDAPARTYWFQERNFAPEFAGERDIGCGKLNLVNVAEPMKLARLMLGVDDRYGDTVRMMPRLPDFWNSCEAEDWPIVTPHGVARADIRFERKNRLHSLTLRLRDGDVIDSLEVCFPNGARRQLRDVRGSVAITDGE